MKRWLFVALAAALLFGAAPLALAAGGGHGNALGHHKFQLVGEIVSVDPVAQTVNVLVKAGTRTVKEYKGGTDPEHPELVLTITSDTRLRVVTGEGCVPATFDQLWPGAKIKAGGTIWSDGLGATIYTAVRAKARGGVEPVVTPVPEPAPDPAPAPDPDPAPAPDPSDSPAAL